MRLRVGREYLGDLIGTIAFVGGKITDATEEQDAVLVRAWFDSPDDAAALTEQLADQRLAGHVEVVDP
jgi:hypothetical protein